jgi:mannose-6-phosphate isomerase-like protein (cupin superfamily)
MKPVIHHPDPDAEYFFAEGCHILESWNQPLDPACSIARARVAPGDTTRWHRLRGISERYLIIRGQGRVEVGELPAQPVGPGDVVLIPPGSAQRITNTGSDELLFYAICTPRFAADAYEDLEIPTTEAWQALEDELLGRFWVRMQGLEQSHDALRVLGLEADAGYEQARARYRKLAMEHHADRGGDTRRLQEINAAMETLVRAHGKQKGG